MYNEQDNLMHYGVLGMKWGIRKGNYSGTYSKAKTKSMKLKAKSTKLSNKLSKTNIKLERAKNKQARTMNEDGKSKYDERVKTLENRSSELTSRSNRAMARANKWVNQMDKAFSKINIDNIPQEDILSGKEYAQYIVALNSYNTSRRYLDAVR